MGKEARLTCGFAQRMGNPLTMGGAEGVVFGDIFIGCLETSL